MSHDPHLFSYSVYLLPLAAIHHIWMSYFTQLSDLRGNSFVCLSVDVPENQFSSQLSKPT